MQKIENANAIVCNDGKIELDVSVNQETLWLSQKQIAEFFEVTIPNINMHIKAIFKEKELEKNATIQKFLIVQKEECKIKHSKLSRWFAFSLMEEDAFELKRRLGKFWMLSSYRYYLTPRTFEAIIIELIQKMEVNLKNELIEAFMEDNAYLDFVIKKLEVLKRSGD